MNEMLDIVWTNVEELASDSYILSALTRSHLGTEGTWGISIHPAASRFFQDR